MSEAREPVFIEAFVTESTVERLDISILIRLTWLDKKQLHATPVRPCQHRFTAELFLVVCPNAFW